MPASIDPLELLQRGRTIAKGEHSVLRDREIALVIEPVRLQHAIGNRRRFADDRPAFDGCGRAGMRRTERGAALVETAFVLPILMLFVLGMIDLAMWNFQRSQTSSSARDGARYASVAVEVLRMSEPISSGAAMIDHRLK